MKYNASQNVDRALRDSLAVREQRMRVQVNHAEGPAVLALRRPGGHSRPLPVGPTLPA